MNTRTLVSKFNIGFITSSSIIFAGAFVVNVLNYVFTLVMSRMVGVAAFGEVTALFSLLLIVSVPAAALSMLMTREAAAQNMSGPGAVRELFGRLQKNVLMVSGGFWVLFLASVPFLSHFLQIDVWPLLVFSFMIPITLASALQMGTLQGLQEFFMLSKQNVLSTVVKLAASIALVMLGFSVIGVILGVVLAQMVSWGYGYMATHRLLRPDPTSSAQKPFSPLSIRSLFTTILATTLLLAFLTNLDVLMAKHFLLPELAGQYSALSTIGKILIYGVGAFITVLLPMVSAAHADEVGGGRGILYLSLSIISCASLVAYGLFYFFPTAIVEMLLGARYLSIAPYLAKFSIAMGCISLATAFINYFVAVKNNSFLYLLMGGMLLEVVAFTLNHATLAAMTSTLVLSAVVLLVLMACNFLVFCRPR